MANGGIGAVPKDRGRITMHPFEVPPGTQPECKGCAQKRDTPFARIPVDQPGGFRMERLPKGERIQIFEGEIK